MRQLLLSSILIFLIGCKPKQPLIINNYERTTVRDSIVKDTVSITVSDSAFLELYLRCQDGQVVIDKELKRLWGSLNLIYSFENGLLKITADYQAELKHEIERLYRIIETDKSQTVIVQPEPPKVEGGVKEWQKPIIFGLWVIVIMACVWIGVKIYKTTIN